MVTGGTSRSQRGQRLGGGGGRDKKGFGWGGETSYLREGGTLGCDPVIQKRNAGKPPLAKNVTR